MFFVLLNFHIKRLATFSPCENVFTSNFGWKSLRFVCENASRVNFIFFFRFIFVYSIFFKIPSLFFPPPIFKIETRQRKHLRSTFHSSLPQKTLILASHRTKFQSFTPKSATLSQHILLFSLSHARTHTHTTVHTHLCRAYPFSINKLAGTLTHCTV